MGRLLKTAVLLIGLAVLAASGAAWYVQPTRALDLRYAEWSLTANIAEMIVKRQLEVELSEKEAADLLKKYIAEHPQLGEHVTITGADFTLDHGRLRAEINLLLGSRLAAGASLDYELSWQAPYLVATPRSLRVRKAEIPGSWLNLEPVRIDPGSRLPKHVGIADMQFRGSGVQIRLGLR